MFDTVSTRQMITLFVNSSLELEPWTENVQNAADCARAQNEAELAELEPAVPYIASAM
jgi:hypothetical protein